MFFEKAFNNFVNSVDFSALSALWTLTQYIAVDVEAPSAGGKLHRSKNSQDSMFKMKRASYE